MIQYIRGCIFVKVTSTVVMENEAKMPVHYPSAFPVVLKTRSEYNSRIARLNIKSSRF